MNFEDMIIQKRMAYIMNIEKRIKKILAEDPLENLKRLMFCPPDIKEKDVVESFIKNAKDNNYFKSLYDKIKSKPFTWENLKEIKEIGGENYYYMDSVVNAFFSVTSIIDRIYAPFLEPLHSFPLIYCSGEYPDGFGGEPNCVGAAQIIAVLYSFDHDIKDLAFAEIYNSKRKDILLQKIKDVYNGETGINPDVEKIFKKIDPNFDYVSIDCDTIHGEFRKEELQNMLLDRILSIEEFSHGVIYNKTTKEFYDYDLERKNYKGVIEYDLKDGIFLSTFANLVTMMNHLNYDTSLLKDAFEKYYTKYRDSVLFNSLGILLYAVNEPEKAKIYLDKIKQIYGTKEELPAKYQVVDILLKIGNDRNKEIKKELNFLKEKYVIPEALAHISQRYCQSDILISLDQSLSLVPFFQKIFKICLIP